MSTMGLITRAATPALHIPLVGGGTYTLGAPAATRFDLVVFYRGLHCPICAKYLIELERLVPEFETRGVQVIAASSDTADRAQAMADKISAKALRIGYDLPLPNAREWGLYISASRGKTSLGVEEPALFNEPGVFIVSPDGSLYYGSTQTMPFARPSFADLLGAIDFAIAKDYPARGEFTGAV